MKRLSRDRGKIRYFEIFHYSCVRYCGVLLYTSFFRKTLILKHSTGDEREESLAAAPSAENCETSENVVAPSPTPEALDYSRGNPIYLDFKTSSLSQSSKEDALRDNRGLQETEGLIDDASIKPLDPNDHVLAPQTL